ncbi:MAG: hypothetical protein ABF649_01300 [Bacillus sp. (in: firmicutes)]
MMIGRARRLHYFFILIKMLHFMKSNLIFFVILFVSNFGTEKLYLKIFQFLFLIYIGVGILFIIVNWITYRYSISDTVIQIKSGVLMYLASKKCIERQLKMLPLANGI